MEKTQQDIVKTKKWFLFYTKSRFEKKVYSNLLNAGFETYLPLYKTYRQWSDRKKLVELPLFPSYIFARIYDNQINNIKQTIGIVKLITFHNIPAIVRDDEIEMLKSLLVQDIEIQVFDDKIDIDSEVTISSGFFKGYSGKVLKIKNTNKIIIEIESIEKSLLVTFNKNQLKLSKKVKLID